MQPAGPAPWTAMPASPDARRPLAPGRPETLNDL
jgi:hypothetical protein